jgi:hypothetical protein
MIAIQKVEGKGGKGAGRCPAKEKTKSIGSAAPIRKRESILHGDGSGMGNT